MTSPSPTSVAQIGTQLRSKSDWKDLIDGRIDAIHLSAFATPTECAELARFIEERSFTYNTAAGIRRLGNSFADARRNGTIVQEYSKPDILEEVIAVNTALSRVLGLVAATWPMGIETFRYEDTVLHRAIGRTIQDTSAEPHKDYIAEEIPGWPLAISVKFQLGLNLYVQVPQAGGELEGWRKRLSPEEYNALRNTDPKLAYGIRRDAIGESDWLIRPDLGDVIIFRNCELHAIRRCAGARSTWGFFTGWRSDDQALLVWA